MTLQENCNQSCSSKNFFWLIKVTVGLIHVAAAFLNSKLWNWLSLHSDNRVPARVGWRRCKYCEYCDRTHIRGTIRFVSANVDIAALLEGIHLWAKTEGRPKHYVVVTREVKRTANDLHQFSCDRLVLRLIGALVALDAPEHWLWTPNARLPPQ